MQKSVLEWSVCTWTYLVCFIHVQTDRWETCPAVPGIEVYQWYFCPIVACGALVSLKRTKVRGPKEKKISEKID